MTSKLNAGEIIVVDQITLADAKTKLMAKMLKNFELKGTTMLVLCPAATRPSSALPTTSKSSRLLTSTPSTCMTF